MWGGDACVALTNWSHRDACVALANWSHRDACVALANSAREKETHRMPDDLQNLTIIGGGIMGLYTAYYASAFAQHITILEKATIGAENKAAASFSYTRSIRND